jgi:hypothetical protein
MVDADDVRQTAMRLPLTTLGEVPVTVLNYMTTAAGANQSDWIGGPQR